MGRLKLLDLFSGIGGFTIAADRADIETVAFCEIGKFPKTVLEHRYPNIPIFDDVCLLTKKAFYEKTKLKGIDIVCGGSPCQDVSVAGRCEGLDGARSGLFFEQVRIAFELKAKYVVWENVPGAFSSAKGRDFARIITEFTGHENIIIPKGGWGNAGFFRGKCGYYNIAYRVFDSRFSGVPQRRRRIFLVASFGDASCAEILFEPESLCGHLASRGKSKKDFAAFAESGFGGYTQTELSPTLTKSSGACSGGSEALILNESSVLFENHSQDCRYTQKDQSPTITSRAGTGGGNLPLVIRQHNHGEVRASKDVPTLNAQSGAGRKPMIISFTPNDAGRDCGYIAPTLRSGGDGGVPVQAVAIAENVINRQDHNGGNGVGALEESCYTLNASGIHAVATRSSVRRLIPLECERLQGFPDEWTNIPKSRDTGRYKALGNAITVNVVEWIFKRIAQCEMNSKARS